MSLETVLKSHGKSLSMGQATGNLQLLLGKKEVEW